MESEHNLIKMIYKLITAAMIIDGQDSPPDSDDVDYLHRVIREARDLCESLEN